ncbi:hypothetical protein F3N42_09810 [Marinihelvus fidelis]|uniref:CSLREA domain-containing protein n=1 Tax=Marinihelvus fidelis TaxID=2613842 RepID=A0A5N0TA02_9GAMM|nr:hypothetical protein [Marinihelvus fidelis]KAA9131601.1 hypothetical protein F3N42_09810 [Marinihelvus fidelis]
MNFARTVIVSFLFVAGVFAPVIVSAATITVEAGDNQGLIDAINTANANGEETTISLVPDADGNTEFVFDMPYQSTGSALPVITSPIDIVVVSDVPGEAGRMTFRRAAGAPEFRAIHFEGMAGNTPSSVHIFDINIVDFSAGTEGGGAILVSGSGALFLVSATLAGNDSSGNGGALRATGQTLVRTVGVRFVDNHANQVGGSISLEGNSQGQVVSSRFENNRAGVFGCDINVASGGIGNGFTVLQLQNSIFEASCNNVTVENPLGEIEAKGNTFFGTGEAFDSTDIVHVLGNIFDLEPPQPSSSQGAQGRGAPVTKALCNDFGIGEFVSLGYNIATVDGCGLDDPTDQVNTDPGLVIGQDGLPVPGPSSPAIESGASEVVVVDGSELASLPCGYVDMTGLGRPQDADGDGEFVCDRGAVEMAGTGMVSAGHSGAFYNSARNGEGNYVEILNDELAVVYTFSYRPDGSGPSWFVGAGEIRGNSIVIDELQRPTGTSFGA